MINIVFRQSGHEIQKASSRFLRAFSNRALRLFLAISLGSHLLMGASGNEAESSSENTVLFLGQVLQSVYSQYPPYLAALIERDVAQGKLRSAKGVFDFQTFVKIFDQPGGFYESSTVEAGFEQFTGIWGSTLYGGYRYTEGLLPDYYYQRRTDGGGAPELGIRLPLLQNRAIDERRADYYKARFEREKAEPSIRKQQLDFIKASMLAYYNWYSEGRKLLAAEELLRIATQRAGAIGTQIQRGLVAPIVEVENRQMVLSRELSLVKARRSFEAASIALSLFYRDPLDEPVVAGLNRVPEDLNAPVALDPDVLSPVIAFARQNRPEPTFYDLELEKLGVDVRLFKNKTLPKLDTFFSASQGMGERIYKDTGELELKVGLEFRLPIQRNEAKGKLDETEAKIEQMRFQIEFVSNQITAEVQNAYSAVSNAMEQFTRSRLNRDLAAQLQEVEQDRFALGANDLLALQLREQSAYQARIDEIDSLHQFYKSVSDFIYAAGVHLQQGEDCPAELKDWLNKIQLNPPQD